MPQSLTRFPTEALTTVQIPIRATFRLPGRSAYLSTEAANPMRVCSDTYLPTDVPTDFEKSGGIFKILVRNSKNTNRNYQRNLMPPPKKILFYVPSVILSVTLQYKTHPPSVVHFFSNPSHSSSLLLMQILCVSHCIFIVLIVVFNILKGMILLSLSLYFCTFYFILIIIIFVVFFVLCIVCR
jgi:hypothetical protein